MKHISVKRLHDELEEWNRIGIGEDIVIVSEQRPEYKHYVKQWVSLKMEPREKAKLVLIQLALELKKPWFLQKTFWHLLKLRILELFQKR